MFYGIRLIILGILAAPSLLLAKQPNAKELLDKVAPYQGWIGIVFGFLGAWGVFQAMLNISLLQYVSTIWITWVTSSALETVFGFLLGYKLIKQHFLADNEQAQEKGEAILEKLLPIQEKLGLAGILMGIWVIIARYSTFG